MDEKLLTPAEVADFLRVGRRTLEQWRNRGGGPPYIRVAPNCVRYSHGQLTEWLGVRTFRHTSEESALKEN